MVIFNPISNLANKKKSIVFLFIYVTCIIQLNAIGLSLFKGAETIQNEIKALNNEQKEIKDSLKDINLKLNDLKVLSDIKAGVNDNTIKNKVNELTNSMQVLEEKINIKLSLIDKLESLLKLENNIGEIQTDISAIKSMQIKNDINNKMNANILTEFKSEINGLNNSIKQSAGRDVVTNESKLIRFIIGAIISNFVLIIIFLLKDNIRQRREFQEYVKTKDLEDQYNNEKFEKLLESKNFYKEKLLSKLTYEEAEKVLKEKRENGK